ncbi:MAG: hypothetical protein ACRCZY_04460 [Phocaeicola sp.]
MTKHERIAIARIFFDLIKADLIIDSAEMKFYNDIKLKYGISRLEEAKAINLALGDAILLLSSLPINVKELLLSDFMEMTMSDGFCSRREALIILALKLCLSNINNLNASVITTADDEFFSDSGQVLYIESEYNENINSQISTYHRYIQKEMKLCGFNFVYIPDIVSTYKKTPRLLLIQVFSFLMPALNEVGIVSLIDKLLNLRSQDFLVSLLCDKLGVRGLRKTDPAILLSIGKTFVGDKYYASLLKIEIGEQELLPLLQTVLDYFMDIQNSEITLSASIENTHTKFLYHGFYKQLVDLYSLKRNVRSRIVIIPSQESFYFPDIDQCLLGLHRKEKALYALFLFESINGGINFNLPKSAKLLSAYKKRIDTIQRKYAKIYEFFGGDGSKAPLLEVPETRRPMLSRIKKSLLFFGEHLHDWSNYLIERDANGFYSIHLEQELLFVKTTTGETQQLSSSELYTKIKKL